MTTGPIIHDELLIETETFINFKITGGVPE